MRATAVAAIEKYSSASPTPRREGDLHVVAGGLRSFLDRGDAAESGGNAWARNSEQMVSEFVARHVI